MSAAARRVASRLISDAVFASAPFTAARTVANCIGESTGSLVSWWKIHGANSEIADVANIVSYKPFGVNDVEAMVILFLSVARLFSSFSLSCLFPFPSLPNCRFIFEHSYSYPMAQVYRNMPIAIAMCSASNANYFCLSGLPRAVNETIALFLGVWAGGSSTPAIVSVEHRCVFLGEAPCIKLTFSFAMVPFRRVTWHVKRSLDALK